MESGIYAMRLCVCVCGAVLQRAFFFFVFFCVFKKKMNQSTPTSISINTDKKMQKYLKDIHAFFNYVYLIYPKSTKSYVSHLLNCLASDGKIPYEKRALDLNEVAQSICTEINARLIAEFDHPTRCVNHALWVCSLGQAFESLKNKNTQEVLADMDERCKNYVDVMRTIANQSTYNGFADGDNLLKLVDPNLKKYIYINPAAFDKIQKRRTAKMTDQIQHQRIIDDANAKAVFEEKKTAKNVAATATTLKRKMVEQEVVEQEVVVMKKRPSSAVCV